ncbi:MAG: hypothetical protein HOW97_21940 [Catenulispora sp.]|nr:hypothetical protein [Catenulispora sp.]
MAAPDSGGDGAPTAVQEPGQVPAGAAVGPAAVDPAAGSAGPTDRPGHQPDPHTPAEDAVAAYLSTARTKLAEWFTSRPAQVSSVDFDEFYFRAVHPAAKRALLRQLTPHASGPFPRPPRLRGDATDPPSGGPPHVP